MGKAPRVRVDPAGNLSIPSVLPSSRAVSFLQWQHLCGNWPRSGNGSFSKSSISSPQRSCVRRCPLHHRCARPRKPGQHRRKFVRSGGTEARRPRENSARLNQRRHPENSRRRPDCLATGRHKIRTDRAAGKFAAGRLTRTGEKIWADTVTPEQNQFVWTNRNVNLLSKHWLKLE